jgi:gentisate 1,2-dioxygenase
MKNLPNVANKWITADSKVFKIEQLVHNDNGVWVHYVNELTGKKYNCLIGAFLQRFKEQLV